jgi:hypothetical protein
MQIRCANCDCFPEDCKNSRSSTECLNCSLEECCCWIIMVVHNVMEHKKTLKAISDK